MLDDLQDCTIPNNRSYFVMINLIFHPRLLFSLSTTILYWLQLPFVSTKYYAKKRNKGFDNHLDPNLSLIGKLSNDALIEQPMGGECSRNFYSHKPNFVLERLSPLHKKLTRIVDVVRTITLPHILNKSIEIVKQSNIYMSQGLWSISSQVLEGKTCTNSIIVDIGGVENKIDKHEIETCSQLPKYSIVSKDFYRNFKKNDQKLSKKLYSLHDDHICPSCFTKENLTIKDNIQVNKIIKGPMKGLTSVFDMDNGIKV